MANSNKPNLAQGEGGAKRTRRSGSHLEQGCTGAEYQGPSGDHMTTQFTSTQSGGSNLDPHPALSDSSPVRGAGGVKGHDRVGPPNRSGSPKAQNPNIKTKS